MKQESEVAWFLLPKLSIPKLDLLTDPHDFIFPRFGAAEKSITAGADSGAAEDIGFGERTMFGGDPPGKCFLGRPLFFSISSPAVVATENGTWVGILGLEETWYSDGAYDPSTVTPPLVILAR